VYWRFGSVEDALEDEVVPVWVGKLDIAESYARNRFFVVDREYRYVFRVLEVGEVLLIW
jgi:hypothetical protein